MKIKVIIRGGRKAALNSMKLTLEVYNELKQKVIFFYKKINFIKYEKTKGQKLTTLIHLSSTKKNLISQNRKKPKVRNSPSHSLTLFPSLSTSKKGRVIVSTSEMAS